MLESNSTKERRGRERFEAAEVRLAPVEDGPLAEEGDVAGHEADDGLVAVDLAERAGDHRQAYRQAREQRDGQADLEDGQRAKAHAARDSGR